MVNKIMYKYVYHKNMFFSLINDDCQIVVKYSSCFKNLLHHLGAIYAAGKKIQDS